jgi:hypothetical protein
MATIKQLGWAGAWVALALFTLGFAAGSVYRSTVTPLAYSAVPRTVTTIPVPPSISATEFTKLAEEVSGMRIELSQMNETLLRIEASLRKR